MYKNWWTMLSVISLLGITATQGKLVPNVVLLSFPGLRKENPGCVILNTSPELQELTPKQPEIL